MVDLGTYEFKDLDTGKISPKEQFIYAYAEEVHESEQVCTSTKLLRVILYDKYEKEYLNKVIENQFQHMREVQHNELLKLLQKIEDFFYGAFGTQKKDPVYF